MDKTIVLYPGLYVSHFVPMMQLADALLEHGYAVAVALIHVTMDEDATFAAAVARVAAAAKPSVTFHKLPRIHDPPAITTIRMNKVFMVEEMGVGVEVAGWHWQRGELVMAEEIEGKIRLVMESEEGERLRSSVAAHGEAAAVAWRKDGGAGAAAILVGRGRPRASIR
uniref:Uncharacterized protein n=1 Tax=Oryza barthii TaxID=65489 RepID=A0A0D3EWS3_9ORYZ